MPNQTTLEFYSGGAYQTFVKSKVTGAWPGNTPNFSVGQGFFLKASTNVVWTETLQ